MFFLISGVTLTGQQSGTVGLRLELTTYLRAPMGADGTAKTVASLPRGQSGGQADSDAGGSDAKASVCSGEAR